MSLPPDHPLHPHIHRASFPIKQFKSLLHNLLQFHGLKAREIEIIHPTRLHPSWTTPFNTLIHQDEEAAIAHNKVNTASVQIYADRSSIDGGVGAAVVLYINNTIQQSLQHYLGREEHHTVYEAELVGLTLAATLLQQLDFLEDTTITIDNQAVITATTNHCSAPGQQLTDVFLTQMTEIARQHQGVPIKIHCIPSHKIILGNKEADRLAKQAAKQQGIVSSITPHILHSPLAHSKTACKTNFSMCIKKAACINFQKLTRFNRIHAIDPKAPSHNYRKLAEGLTQCHSGILMQLRTSRSGHSIPRYSDTQILKLSKSLTNIPKDLH